MSCDAVCILHPTHSPCDAAAVCGRCIELVGRICAAQLGYCVPVIQQMNGEQAAAVAAMRFGALSND